MISTMNEWTGTLASVALVAGALLLGFATVL
jgi:hypothetical protein